MSLAQPQDYCFTFKTLLKIQPETDTHSRRVCDLLLLHYTDTSCSKRRGAPVDEYQEW